MSIKALFVYHLLVGQRSSPPFPSLGELAELVGASLPAARSTFEYETGGKERSGNYLVDNSRLRQEFEVEYPPFRQRVLEIINDIRRDEGLPLIQR